MGWWIFLAIVCLTAFLLVPVREWRRHFIIGIFGLIIILFIDSSLAALKAFQFNYSGLKVLGLPFPYWISFLPGGILFAHFRPFKWLHRLLYIIFTAVIFVFIEFITIRLGLFQHLNWNLFKAFFLNIVGFTILLWFTEWLSSANKKVSAS